jgi:hypothetical protein
MRSTGTRPALAALAAAALGVAAAPLWGQPPGAQRVSENAQAAAPFDPAGYWVSIVTQDWVFRMAVPQRGQYSDVPLTLKAKQFADAWQPGPDEAAGRQCEAYGAPAIMQIPERLHIGWQDPDTLEVQSDAGMQTRLLHFRPSAEAAAAPASWQGYTTAQWMLYRAAAQRAPQQAIPPAGQAAAAGPARPAKPVSYGWLQAVTTHLRPGLLRKNGVPYSAQTNMTENWQLNDSGEDYGGAWLTVTTILRDPQYLAGPYVENALFNREADGSKWAPAPCSLEE